MRIGFRELVFVTVMVGVLLSSYFFIFKNSNARRAQLDDDTRQKQASLLRVRQATSGISDLKQKIDELKSAIDFFQARLPQQREVDTILNEVTKLTEASGLQTKTVRTTKGEVTSNYCEQPIQMTLSGDFKPGFYSFLLQLEKLPRLTRLTQMKLEKINEHDGAMSAQLTISIFFEPDPDAGASASAR